MNKNKFLFPLNNLQLFAEAGGEGSGGSAGGEPGASVITPTQAEQIDYSKIEEIVSKRSSQTSDSVLKGYLKQQGLSGEELDQAVNNYKTQKQQEELLKKQEAENIKLENQQLRAQILNSNIDAKLTALAAGEGVAAEKIPFLSKLISRDGLADEKGNVLDEKVKEQIQEVLKAFPEMKGNSQQQGGFQQIGGAGNQQQTSTVDDQLDAIFGIKKK